MLTTPVVIIGAGPAGLTAALECLRAGFSSVTVLEADDQVGGISRTVHYKGNRIDIGGHRFFSKSDWVMHTWQELLPLQGAPASDEATHGVGTDFAPGGPDPESSDAVMLVRSRLSRILYQRKYFDYPVSASLRTFANLGMVKTLCIGCSYLKAMLFPIREEKNLEDFFINRFGKALYATFFRDYTEKVWGLPCNKIAASWGAQRIKGISIMNILLHMLKKPFSAVQDVAQKNVEASLIERFLYPKFGPGQLWEEAARQVAMQGGQVRMGHRVERLECEGNRVVRVVARDSATGEEQAFACGQVLSSMPMQHLIPALNTTVPDAVKEVAQALPYRDFITVGVLARKLGAAAREGNATTVRDNWIYIQEPDVKVGRLQIFNNWSPYLVAQAGTVWLGMEYFCQQGDTMWNTPDDALRAFAVEELHRLGIVDDPADVLDSMVLRVPKAYPAYFGAYARFGLVQDWLNTLPNVWPMGRNGMHRYNNMDHSMLSAKEAVACIVRGSSDKSALWQINAEEVYHEQK